MELIKTYYKDGSSKNKSITIHEYYTYGGMSYDKDKNAIKAEKYLNGSLVEIKDYIEDIIKYFDNGFLYRKDIFSNNILDVSKYYRNGNLDRIHYFSHNKKIKLIYYFDLEENVYLEEYFDKDGKLHHKKIID